MHISVASRYRASCRNSIGTHSLEVNMGWRAVMLILTVAVVVATIFAIVLWPLK